MGFLGKLGGALSAPFKATGSLVKGAAGATKSMVTGHPVAAAKQIGGGAKTATRTITRSVSGRR